MVETVLDDEIVINDAVRWNLLQRGAQAARALRAVTLLREQGIEPVLIKGFAAGLNYPQDKLRDCVDVDLAVAPADFDRALKTARSKAADGYAIDLHRGLRHLDTVAWVDLFDNSRLLDVDGGSIRVLRPEDHLRVLCVHWLTDGGRDKDRLWDIYYAVENRPADFDWDRFLMVGPRRRRWLECTIGLAHRYLGLNIDGLPVETSARSLPSWLIDTLEREWASELKDTPLEILVLHDPLMFLKQVGKRLRPNPIWATVQAEGDLDARTRVFYQAANLVRRIPSSYRRVSGTIKRRIRERGR